MLAMVSGSVGFAPNPADGLIFFFEPSRPLAPTIIKNIDELSSPPVERDAVRDRRRAAVLGGDALARRLGGQAADEEVRGRRDGAHRAPARLRPGRRPPAQHRRRSSRQRRLAPRRPDRPRVLLGARACSSARSRRRSSSTCWSRGSSTCSPELLDTPPEGRLHPGRDRRLPRPADRHAARRRDGDGDRAAGRRRDRRLAERVRAARSRSRGSPSRRSR